MTERKCFGLSPARTPQKSDVLSGVVVVADKEGKGHAYIHFAPQFVEHVGKLLPEGLRKDHPAYIKAQQIIGTDRWRIFAMYLNETRGVVLWDTETKPLWLAKIRRTT